jgi:hypothetical protein
VYITKGIFFPKGAVDGERPLGIYQKYRSIPQADESTHSTPRSEARGMLRVDTERRFLPRFKNRGLAPSNVSK